MKIKKIEYEGKFLIICPFYSRSIGGSNCIVCTYNKCNGINYVDCKKIDDYLKLIEDIKFVENINDKE